MGCGYLLRRTSIKSLIRKKYIMDDSSTSIKIKQVVTYIPNRAILFPANIWHQALEPNRSFNGLRVSLAYKLELL